jgi:hypothetical protein
MKAARFPISADKLGRVYGLTGERVRQLIHLHGFDIVAEPAALFHALVNHGNDSMFRCRLAQPEIRELFTNQIKAL